MPMEIHHFINGQVVTGQSTRSGPVLNPASGEQSASVELASKADTSAAIEAAQSGCSVIVLEKMKGFGGNSTISDGAMAAAGSDMQIKAGIDDTPERMAGDMIKAGLGLNQPGLV